MTVIVDSNFPGLRAALDRQWVLELLRRDLAVKQGLEISDVAVRASHYRPGESCTVVYNVKVWDRNAGRSRQETLFARLLQAGEEPVLPSRDTVERFSALPNKYVGAAALYSPEAGIVLYTSPIDPSLPWLLDAFEPKTIREQLNRTWPLESPRLQRVSTRLQSYWPQARAVLRFDWVTEASRTVTSGRTRVIGKMNPFRDPSQMFASSWALWSATRG
ncbi:MAG: hypothetical protein ACE5Q6_07285, partial [Dehalococcoidia bacterium]